MNDDISASGSDPFVLLPRATQNSRVVRELDPRASRNLWVLLFLVGGLVGGVVLYAWPRVQALNLDTQTQQSEAQLERLVEENRKLRLEKATFEALEIVQDKATRYLGLVTPSPDRLHVIERPAPPVDGRVARAPDTAEAH